MAVLGSTVDPRLGAVNPAAIQALSQAGAATGQMYQNLGQSIKGVVSDAQDRKISNNLYEALGESVFDVSQATGVDRNAVTSMLEAARANGLPALRQLQDTFTGFLKADYGADREALQKQKDFENTLERMDFAETLTQETMDVADKYLKENKNIADQYERRILDDTQDHSLLFQGRGFGQQTKERRGKEKFLTSERLGEEKFITSERLGKQKFLDSQARKGESFTDFQRKAREEYERLQDKRRSDLKKSETDNLYGNMLYLQKEFDLAKSNNDVARQKAIRRDIMLIDEEIIERQTKKSNDLMDRFREARKIGDPSTRDFEEQKLQAEAEKIGLAVPNLDKFVFSMNDLSNRISNDTWNEENIPRILKGVLKDNERHSAEAQYGFFLLASQGELFPDDPGKNKKYLQEFGKKYDIQDGWLKGVIDGTGLIARKTVNFFDLDLVIDDMKVMEDGIQSFQPRSNLGDASLNVETLNTGQMRPGPYADQPSFSGPR